MRCETDITDILHSPGTLVLTIMSGDSEVVTSNEDSDPEHVESLPLVQVLSRVIWPQRT